jgi:hypothetical protein
VGWPLVAVVALDQEALFRWHQAQRLDAKERASNAPLVVAAVLPQLQP